MQPGPDGIPWHPDAYVQVSPNDSYSFMTDSVLIRFTTRVKAEDLPRFFAQYPELERLLNEPVRPEIPNKEITYG